VRFLFDFISPYGYLGWKRIHAIADAHGRVVEPVPVLFAGLLGAHGTKGPAEVPAKRRYVFIDVMRQAHVHGIPFGLPPAHPFNPLVALRAAGMVSGAAQRTLIDALFAAVWGGGGAGIDSADKVAAAAASAGLDGAAIAEAAGTPEAKARLRTATDDAIAAGVFGVPTVLVDGAMFWGNDGLVHLDRFLGGDDPLAGVDVARWDALPSAAERKTT
jgi:2-hydroxychromene-2-carboxylate isomerase